MRRSDSQLVQQYGALIEEHREWLMNPDRRKKWEDLLRSEPEAAICEAATRRLLSDHGCHVGPHEDPSSGGPDFFCDVRGHGFYVETTCATIDVVTKETGLEDILEPVGRATGLVDLEKHDADFEQVPPEDPCLDYTPMTRLIFRKCPQKTRQLAKHDAPGVLCIGTLHGQAGCREDLNFCAGELLTGVTHPTFQVNRSTGGPASDTYEATFLESAAFLRWEKGNGDKMKLARGPVSALLLCGFGAPTATVIGVLHPNPAREFHRDLLPCIPFRALGEGWQEGRIKVQDV